MAKKKKAVVKGVPAEQSGEQQKPSLDDILDDVATGMAVKGDEQKGELPANGGLKWAEACLWASEHLDERMTRAKAGSGLRYAVWKQAKADLPNFLGSILPRTMQILDRHQSKEIDDVVERAEVKSIEQLQKILQRAVREASGSYDTDGESTE